MGTVLCSGTRPGTNRHGLVLYYKQSRDHKDSSADQLAVWLVEGRNGRWLSLIHALLLCFKKSQSQQQVVVVSYQATSKLNALRSILLRLWIVLEYGSWFLNSTPNIMFTNQVLQCMAFGWQSCDKQDTCFMEGETPDGCVDVHGRHLSHHYRVHQR